jgi:hypothetical protein
MGQSKYSDTIAELEAQRADIDAAIAALRRIEARQQGASLPVGQSDNSGRIVVSSRVVTTQLVDLGKDSSYPAIAYQAIKTRGVPLHISEILSEVAKVKGLRTEDVNRASVESSLHKAIAEGPWAGKLTKPSTATYGAE